MAADSPWLNPQQASQYAHRHPQTLAREVRAGRLRAARVGGRGEYFYRAEWLDEWLEGQALPIVITPRRRLG